VDTIARAHDADVRPEERYRPVARFLLALTASVLVVLIWWSRVPRQLHVTTDILGYPTFTDFNYTRLYTAYRLIVYVIPAITLAVYVVLAWKGPLRRPPRLPRPVITMSDAAHVAQPELAVPVPDSGRAADGLWTASAVLRLLLPAGVLAIEISTTSRSGFTGLGLMAGGCYLVLVAATTAFYLAVQPERSESWWQQIRAPVAVINGIAGSVITVLGLWLVSQHTAVHIIADHRTTSWHWLPLWLVTVGAAAVVGYAVWRLRQGLSAAVVEYQLLAAIVGSVLVFLIVSILPGQSGHFQGFDDSLDLAGSNLLAKGYFPWRDLMFVHGLWADVLQATLSTSLFENSRWGNFAGILVVINPLCWVALYLLVVWFARRNSLLVAAFVLLVVSGQLGALTWRFILVPLVVIMFGGTVRRRSISWTAGLTVVLFAQAVLVPETSYLVVAVLVALVLCDFVHRVPGEAWTRSFRRTIWTVATGVTLVLGFAIFLLSTRSLSGFVDYYRVFAPGHDAAGAVPASSATGAKDWVKFGVAVGLVLLTGWSAIARFRARRSWTSRDWVVLAYAGFVALYAEKPLGRLDSPHIRQFLGVALPLALMWTITVVRDSDRLLTVWWRRAAARPYVPIRRPMSAVAAVLALLAVPSLTSSIDDLPTRTQATSISEPTIPRLGYATRSAVDPHLLSDLQAIIDTYAGATGPVFDMTNSPGYLYYLLDREPGTRYYHVSMAVPPYAQRQVVSELRRSRPAVVIYDSTSIGLPSWDGISNAVRHYIISQYLLDGWTPLVLVDGELVMVRRDLIGTRPLPPLSGPTRTSDLYFTTSECSWGDIPNFFRPTPSGATVDLTVNGSRSEILTTIRGWAVDPHSLTPVPSIVLVSGQKVLSVVHTGASRPDVAQTLGTTALNSGFVAGVVAPRGGAPIVPLALTGDGVLRPIAAAPAIAMSSLQLPGGKVTRVIRDPVLGGLDSAESVPTMLNTITIPSGLRLADYALTTFDTGTPGAIGPADIWIADDATDPLHRIAARALATAGSSIAVRVGSCLQWHGYSSRTLYLQQTGGTPITRIRLSGVR
jgi:hypothetical protein